MEEYCRLLQFVSYFEIMYYKPVYIFNYFQLHYNIKLHMQSKNQPTYFKKAFLLGALLSCSFADSVTVPLPTYVPAGANTFAPASSIQASTSTQNPLIFAALPAASTANNQSATASSSTTATSTSSIPQNNANRQSAPIAVSVSNNVQAQANLPQYSNYGGQFNRKFDDGRKDDFPSKNGNNGKSSDSTNAPQLSATQSNSTASSNQSSLFASKVPHKQGRSDDRDRWPQNNDGNTQGSKRQPQSAPNTTNLFQNSNQAGSSVNSKLPSTATNGKNGFEEKGVQNNRRQGNDRADDRDDGSQSNGQNRPSRRSYDDQDNENRRGRQNINQNRRRNIDEDEDRNEEQRHPRNQNNRSYNDEDDRDDESRGRRSTKRQYDDEEEDEDRFRPSRRNQRDDYEERSGRSSRRHYDDEEEEPRKRSTRRYESNNEEDSSDHRPCSRYESSRNDDSRESSRSNGRSSGSSRQHSNLRHYD